MRVRIRIGAVFVFVFGQTGRRHVCTFRSAWFVFQSFSIVLDVVSVRHGRAATFDLLSKRPSSVLILGERVLMGILTNPRTFSERCDERLKVGRPAIGVNI